MSKAKTHLYSMKFQSELRKHGKKKPEVSHPRQLSAKIKGIICNYANELGMQLIRSKFWNFQGI